jgi:hypothetical protein
MIRDLPAEASQVTEHEWVGFPGGELEGKRSKTLCPSCRERLRRTDLNGRLPRRAAGARLPHTLCFQCYRAELDRERALKAAGDLDTASSERFQTALPFEPVNTLRLDELRAERAASRVMMREGAGRFVDRRRQAQIAARHAFQQVAASLRAPTASGPSSPELWRREQEHVMAAAFHAAELQLPESWLPFVVSR